MRKIFSLFTALIIILTACSCTRDQHSLDAIKSLLRNEVKLDICEKVQAIRVNGTTDYYVGVCEYDPDWSESLHIFHVKDGEIDWEQVIEEVTAPSIDSIRSFELDGIGSVVEIIDQTHCGNGDLYLFQLDGRKRKLLLQTNALDKNDDGFLIRGGKAKIIYKDMNADAYSDVILSGIIDSYDEKGNKRLGSVKFSKTFLWEEQVGQYKQKSCFPPEQYRTPERSFQTLQNAIKQKHLQGVLVHCIVYFLQDQSLDEFAAAVSVVPQFWNKIDILSPGMRISKANVDNISYDEYKLNAKVTLSWPGGKTCTIHMMKHLQEELWFLSPHHFDKVFQVDDPDLLTPVQ